MNDALREELLAMQAEDVRVRAQLLDNGTLGDGYNPRMREVHERNAARLKEIIAASGWPSRSLVGYDGTHAAWRIVQHAIGDPDFQRGCVPVIEAAVARGDAPPAQLAFLVDRIRYFEGKPQIYGTQFDVNEKGETAPWPIEDPNHVDERRRAVGLNSIAERTREMREQVTRESPNPPKDYEAQQQRYQAWLREVGWRK